MKSLLFSCIIYFSCAMFCLGQFEQKINSTTGAASDHFGEAVSVYGNVAVIGAHLDNGAFTDQGSISIYRFDGSQWMFEQKIEAADGAQNDNFGISVDVHNEVIAIGASFTDDSFTNSGSVYIYRYNGSSWILDQELHAALPAQDDEFGHAIDLDENRIIIGAYRADGAGITDRGAVYIFDYNGTSWNETQKITYAGANQDDFFGYDVALKGNRAVVGAYLDDDNGVNSGSAFIYDLSGSWNLTQKITPTDGMSGDAFGFSVDLWQDKVACGAYANSAKGPGFGAVYIFELNGTWTQDTTLYASDGNTDDWFGYDVSFDSTSLLVGAFHNDDFGAESGSAYFFRHNGNDWLEEMNITASDAALGDEFGQHLKIHGMQMIIGSALDDDNGSNSGSAYLYPICHFKPKQEICLTSAEHTLDDNIVIWKKPKTTLIDSFNLFRNGFLSQTQSYNQFSEFIDPVDPSANFHQYQLSTTNTCGLTSDTSSIHQTNHLVGALNGSNHFVLNWSGHSGFPFSYYRVWRDTNSSGNFHLIFATLNSQFTYTDTYQPISGAPSYYIEAEKGSACNSGNTVQASNYSNIFDFIELGIGDIHSSIVLYPNPSSNRVHVTGFTGMASMTVIDGKGKLALRKTVYPNETIDISHLNAGFYFVQLFFEKDVVVNCKLIVK